MFAMLAVQPMIGGWAIYRDRGMLDLHAMVANTMFMVAILMLALSIAAGFQRKPLIAGVTGLLLVVLTAQMGLGYGGEGRPTVAALHIPVGVLAFGVGLLLMLIAHGFTLRRDGV